MTTQQVDALDVRIFSDRRTLSAAAAIDCARAICEAVDRHGWARVIWASAPSQSEFLAALAADQSVPWTRVVAFHMDEYVGMGPQDSASFRRYLRERLPSAMAAFYEIHGEAQDLAAECARYAALLAEEQVDICCLGIGENGHLAFNEPSSADFDDPVRVKIVRLEQASRLQQVHDGCFPEVDVVPTHAVSLTIPALLSARRLFCVVPGATKAMAVQQVLEAPISPACPATVLRTHPAASLYLDLASAQFVS